VASRSFSAKLGVETLKVATTAALTAESHIAAAIYQIQITLAQAILKLIVQKWDAPKTAPSARGTPN